MISAKILLKNIMVIVALFLLVGCASSKNLTNHEATGENTQCQELHVQAAIASDTLLNKFSLLHEFNYSSVRGHGNVGDRLVVWSNTSISEFAVVNLVFEEFIIPTEYFAVVNELPTGQAVVINFYTNIGTMPASGITFVDGSGERRYFWMLHDQSVSIEPNP